MVIIVTGYALFVTSQYAVIFTFQNNVWPSLTQHAYYSTRTLLTRCCTMCHCNVHKLSSLQAEPCERLLGPPKKIQRGPFNISKRLGSCVLFRASYKLAPWAALFQNLTKLNQ